MQQRCYAFFDLDGTLISEASMISFLRFYFEAQDPVGAMAQWDEFLNAGAALRAAGAPREELNAWYYRTYFTGVRVSRLAELGAHWAELRSADSKFFKRDVIGCVARHRREGTTVVLATGSFREVVAPLAARFGIDRYLCAPLEEVGGYYTGALLTAPTIGAGKAAAVQRFLAERNAAARDCYGYGDDDSDIPFLERLGHARVVADAPSALLAHARAAGWGIVGEQEVAERPPTVAAV